MSATSSLPKAPESARNLAQNAEAPKGGLGVEAIEAIAAVRESVAEPKLDGWRLLVHVAEDGVHLRTRSAKSATGKLPHVEEELASYLPPGTWIDGEAVAFTVEGGVRHDWGSVQSVLGSDAGKARLRGRKVTFVAFDLLAYDGIDARGLPLRERRALLEQAVRESDNVRLSEQREPTSDELARALDEGYEGLIVKALDAHYASGRRSGAGWTKFKPTKSLDGVVMGFTDGKASFEGLAGAIRVGQVVDGELVEVLTCSGMDMATRRDMTDNPERWIGRVVEVAFQERMPTGGYRSPQFKRLREDKDPAEAVEKEE